MNQVAAIILQNKQGNVLLYLRDNKPSIPFPHHWDLFGGHVEEGETPEEALERELKEELGIELHDYKFFKKYEVTEGDVAPNTKYIYSGVIDVPANELTLHEGERLSFFKSDEIPNLPIANVLKEIILDYLSAANGLRN